MCTVELQAIRKAYGKFETIHGVDLAIGDRDFVVFVGPSGCGKSTLLRLIAGLEDITSGRLLIDGQVMNHATPKERGVAMVFQSYALYPHMTVYQNMAFGLELSKTAKETIDDRVRRAGEILQLTPLLDRLPKQLSGGQRQRVAIGRAIVREPRLFLFDEPLSNLDAGLRVQTRIEIAKLHQRMGVTMAYVTHDQVEAMTLADKIVVLNAGRIEQVGSPLDLYDHPANRFVAGFIGSPRMNLVAAGVVDADPTGVKLVLDGGPDLVAQVQGGGIARGSRVTLGIRPEHILTDPASAAFEAPIEVVEQLGESHYLYVRAPDGSLLTVKGPGVTRLRSGMSVPIGIPAHACHVFADDETALRRRVRV